MADESSTPTQQSRPCPECGHACAPGQRRCTNCGAAVATRRPLPRRTPLVAALIVAALGGGAVVVAQAEVTERASAVASTTPDPAAAPVPVMPAPLPDAERQTSTKPKPPPAEEDLGNPLEIPTLDEPVVQQAQDERNSGADDDANLPTDTKADPDDLQDEQRIKVRRAFNFDPKQRVGAEFGKPKAAIDKRSRTVWDVSVPGDGEQFGVGIVLDLGETHRVAQIRISTPTPGFGAVVYHADAEDRPEQLDDTWTRAKKLPAVRDELEVPLADQPVWARYILVLLTTPRSDADTRVAIGNLEVLP